MSREVRVSAPPKLNLGLRVLGKREDGFHEVETTLIALEGELDELSLSPLAEGPTRLEISGPAASADVPRDASNLVWRALQGVLDASGRGDRGLWIRLLKRLPSGAGLGGGSSDAAAAALAMTLLSENSVDEAAIASMLGELGADCPFFFVARETGAARCTGRGERVEVLSVPKELLERRFFCVITPTVHCATAQVYAACGAAPWKAGPHEPALPEPRAIFEAPLEQGRALLENDLEEPALRTHPELANVRAFLNSNDAQHFRLSGSGSSFFGMFDTRASAEEALLRLREGSERSRVVLRGAFVTRATNRGATPLSSK